MSSSSRQIVTNRRQEKTLELTMTIQRERSRRGRVVTEIFGRKYVVANVIETELRYPYKSYMELLYVDSDWGDTRWIDIKTSAGRAYKVKLVKKSNYYVLTDGWTLVAVCERLKAGLNVRFHYHGVYITLAILSHAQDEHKRGFADAMPLNRQVSRSTHGVYKGEGGALDEQTEKAITTLRAAANVRHILMYVCTINKSQRNEMYFSIEFSDILPIKKETVALHFVGSPVAISASIRRYGKACTKIMNGWKEFVAEHQINQGDRLAFRYYQGPNVYKMMVCRV